ncbi:hypothetical protein BKA93DRAFT_160245 [Sparassis latifolia]
MSQTVSCITPPTPDCLQDVLAVLDPETSTLSCIISAKYTALENNVQAIANIVHLATPISRGRVEPSTLAVSFDSTSDRDDKSRHICEFSAFIVPTNTVRAVLRVLTRSSFLRAYKKRPFYQRLTEWSALRTRLHALPLFFRSRSSLAEPQILAKVLVYCTRGNARTILFRRNEAGNETRERDRPQALAALLCAVEIHVRPAGRMPRYRRLTCMVSG